MGEDVTGTRRFRLTGRPSEEGWLKDWIERGKPVPWCEFTLFQPQHGEQRVCSYGGELWPLAWPEFFYRKSAEYALRLTDEGKRLIDACLCAVSMMPTCSGLRTTTFDS
jgi:hypothetical protein